MCVWVCGLTLSVCHSDAEIPQKGMHKLSHVSFNPSPPNLDFFFYRVAHNTFSTFSILIFELFLRH